MKAGLSLSGNAICRGWVQSGFYLQQQIFSAVLDIAGNHQLLCRVVELSCSVTLHLQSWFSFSREAVVDASDWYMYPLPGIFVYDSSDCMLMSH